MKIRVVASLRAGAEPAICLTLASSALKASSFTWENPALADAIRLSHVYGAGGNGLSPVVSSGLVVIANRCLPPFRNMDVVCGQQWASAPSASLHVSLNFAATLSLVPHSRFWAKLRHGLVSCSLRKRKLFTLVGSR